jgi:hypothetical protein
MSKSRTALLILAVISFILLMLVEFVFKEMPDYLLGFGQPMSDMTYDLTIGYLSAFLFYTIDVWIPELSNQKRIENRIKQPLNRIIVRTNDLLERIPHLTEDNFNFKSLSERDIQSYLRDVSLTNTQTDVMKSLNESHNLFSLMITINYEIHKQIKQVFSTPFNLDFNLILILDEIQNSDFSNTLDQLYSISTSGNYEITGSFISQQFSKYIRSIQELNDYLIRHNLKN